MRKKILGIILVCLVLGGIWYAAAHREPATPIQLAEATKVRIAYLPVVQGLPLYVALEKGYFKEAGLEAELIKFEAPNQIIDAIMLGQVDFTSPSGALGITGIADYKNPGKLKVFSVAGGTSGNSGVNLVVPTSSTLRTIGDLRGKKLGILAGTIQWRTIAREILQQNGLDMDKDLTIVELAPSVQVQTLASGQVDALLALEPVPTIVVGKGIGKILVADPTVKYISDPQYYGAGVLNAQFAAKNPHTTAKVVEIIARAIADIKKNPDQARHYLKGYTALTEDLINKVPMVDFKVCGSLTPEDKEALQKFFNIFTKHKVVDGKIELEKLLYCS